MHPRHYQYSPDDIKRIKELAGKVPARLIAEELGKSRYSILRKIRKLGLDSRVVGEHHWNARLPNLSAAMVGVLADAGFAAKEIQQVLNTPQDITLNMIYDIGECRTRAYRRST